MKTTKANCDVVLMTRTIPPTSTLGSRFIIARPLSNSLNFDVPELGLSAPTKRFRSSHLLTHNASTAPTDAKTSELHNVGTTPIRSIA